MALIDHTAAVLDKCLQGIDEQENIFLDAERDYMAAYKEDEMADNSDLITVKYSTQKKIRSFSNGAQAAVEIQGSHDDSIKDVSRIMTSA